MCPGEGFVQANRFSEIDWTLLNRLDSLEKTELVKKTLSRKFLTSRSDGVFQVEEHEIQAVNFQNISTHECR